MAHVNDEKKQVVKELLDLAGQYNIIGVVNMQNLPAQQLQGMRAQLREKNVAILMAKKRLIRIAFDKLKGKKTGIDTLTKHMRGMPALIFTNDNPFTLFKIIEKNKSPAPAKAGQVAPKDVFVKAGSTPFQPGPIIGELGSIGVKTRIDNGKIVITEDSVVVREGEEISEKTAGLLTRLDIKPMEVGLDLIATWEDGNIFTKKVLAIDEEEYKDNIAQAQRWAFNLAIGAGVLTAETTEFMLIKAFSDAKALALEENILTDLTAGDILAKAERQMLSLTSQVNLEEPPQEEKKEDESKAEESAEEKAENTQEEQPEESDNPEN